MKKIKQFCGSRIGFALTSNLITLLVSLFLFRPFLEESDDVGIALIAEGAYGYREYHLNYSNTIYGRLLCALQWLMPPVRWHSVLMIAFAFIVFTAFVYVLAENRKGRILSLILLSCSFYELYVAVQFSKISAFIAIAAYMILFELIRKSMTAKEKRILAVLAVICIVYAEMLRLESFLLATMLAGSYGICLAIYECIKGEFVQKIKTYCAYFVPVFAIVGICIFVNHCDNSVSGWKEYIECFDSTAQMVDYHFNALLYDRHGEELEKLGVSENDALMYITYGSLGERITTTDLMDSISALDKKGPSYVDVDFLKAWIANIYEEIFNLNSVVIGLILLLGIVAACILKSGRKTFYAVNIIIQAAIFAAVMFYYQYSSRWCHRIVYALLLSELVLVVCLLYDMDSTEIPDSYIAGICLMIIVSAVYFRLGNEFVYQEYKRNVFDYGELISYMEDNKDKVFVADVFTILDYGRYDVFRAARKGQFDNCLQTDSVLIANSPLNSSIAQKYGYIDPFDALTSRDENVILVDAMSPEVELTFCNEHGDGDYSLEPLETVAGINLYRIK